MLDIEGEVYIDDASSSHLYNTTNEYTRDCTITEKHKHGLLWYYCEVDYVTGREGQEQIIQSSIYSWTNQKFKTPTNAFEDNKRYGGYKTETVVHACNDNTWYSPVICKRCKELQEHM